MSTEHINQDDPAEVAGAFGEMAAFLHRAACSCKTATERAEAARHCELAESFATAYRREAAGTLPVLPRESEAQARTHAELREAGFSILPAFQEGGAQ